MKTVKVSGCSTDKSLTLLRQFANTIDGRDVIESATALIEIHLPDRTVTVKLDEVVVCPLLQSFVGKDTHGLICVALAGYGDICESGIQIVEKE